METILPVFIILFLPVGLGMLLKYKKPNFALRMEKPVKKVSGIFFVVVLIAILIKERTLLIKHIQEAGLVTLTLSIIKMSIGYFLGSIFNLPLKQRISVAIEGDIQKGNIGY